MAGNHSSATDSNTSRPLYFNAILGNLVVMCAGEAPEAHGWLGGVLWVQRMTVAGPTRSLFLEEEALVFAAIPADSIALGFR